MTNAPSQMPELKPCPFCGGSEDYPAVILKTEHCFHKKFWEAGCTSCGARAAPSDTYEEAVRMWNMRP